MPGFLRAVVPSLVALVVARSAAKAGEPDPRAMADKAKSILKTYCHRCHGQDGANEGGFNYTLELKQLVSHGKVIPGKPAKSRIIKRMTSEADPMPPEEEKLRPGKEEIEVLRKWIAVGAPPD